MTLIDIYSSDASKIEECADKNNISVADVVEYLMNFFEEMKEDEGLD